MANSNGPFGARLIGHLSGSTYNARIRTYVVAANDATALYLGDFVKATGEGQANEYGTQLPTATAAAAGDVLLGVVVGFMPNVNDLSKQYRPASTLRTVLVCDDPNAIFEIQSTGTVVAADFGQNADISYAAGSSVWGTSATQLDHASLLQATGQLRIFGMSQRVDNELGAYCKLTCMINEHLFKQIAGV
jgi:hypothetical protein